MYKKNTSIVNMRDFIKKMDDEKKSGKDIHVPTKIFSNRMEFHAVYNLVKKLFFIDHSF